MKHEIRIIGGMYRGKKIKVPDVEGLRPTPDRVRETLFNWLMNHVKDARCLDAFAGTGALGFEAFSRGTSHVVFVEASPIACKQLKTTIQEFKTNQLQLVQEDALSYLAHCQRQFDLIFLDPPFSKNYHLQCLELIQQQNILAPDGLIYIESPEPLELDDKGWKTVKLKQAGHVYYGLLAEN